MGRLAGIAGRDVKPASMETLQQADVSKETGVARVFHGIPGERTATIFSGRARREVCADPGCVVLDSGSVSPGDPVTVADVG